MVFAIRNSSGIKAPNLGLLNGKIREEVIKYNQGSPKQPATIETPFPQRTGVLTHITQKDQIAVVRNAYVRLRITKKGFPLLVGSSPAPQTKLNDRSERPLDAFPR